jgi:hypothetical protein
MVGHHVSANHVLVTRVAANEGFFVQTCDERTVWVRLTGHGESPAHIRQHDRVTINGTVRRVTSDSVTSGMSVADADRIRDSGVLLSVRFDDVHVT